MLPIPHEFALGDIYLPPMLVAAIAATALAALSARLLNRFGWSRHFFYPPVVMLSMMVLYTVLIGTFVIAS